MKTATQLKAKARNLSKKAGVPPHIIQRSYFLECFLERVSLSQYKDEIILKGGVLIASLLGIESRATIDLDATMRMRALSPDVITKIVEDILSVPVPDNVIFSIAGVEETRIEADYPGCRVTLSVLFDNLRDAMKLDFTAGDIITPQPVEYGYRLIFEDREIRVLAYNIETVLAEKFAAMLSLGVTNTRMKDYYDIYMLVAGNGGEISKDIFAEAAGNTVKQRQMLHLLPQAPQIIETIANSDHVAALWRRFRSANPYAAQVEFPDVTAALQTLSEWSNPSVPL